MIASGSGELVEQLLTPTQLGSRIPIVGTRVVLIRFDGHSSTLTRTHKCELPLTNAREYKCVTQGQSHVTASCKYGLDGLI